MRTKIVLGVVFLYLGLCACKPSTSLQTAHFKTEVVHVTTLNKTLNFTGTIQPLRESAITSPMNAVVESMPYHYGQYITQGDTVFTLNSAELQREYNDTLTDYLKAKDSYDINLSKFTGTEELWRAGLLSKNNYLGEKSALNTTRITLMQATRKLSELLEKVDDSERDDLSHLSFSEFDKVRLALTSKHNLIHLKTPSKGVLLYPPKAGEERLGRLSVGMAVKSGQVLALIGDLSGIRVEIDVPEVDIADVNIGMPATIRGLAFGRHVLRGRLVAINAEASTTNGSALPSFTAIVEVRALTKQEQTWVKVGMSAAIELTLQRANKMLIPIDAVQQKAGKRVVRVRVATGAIQLRTITTGPVNGDKVVVESGLHEGDVVVYE